MRSGSPCALVRSRGCTLSPNLCDMRRRGPFLAALVLVLLGACSNEDEPMTAPESTPAASPASETPSAPETSPSEEAPAVDVKAEADEIVSCLADEGMEAKFEKGSFPTFEEAGTIAVTFEYEDLGLKVPDAVTLWLHDSEEAAQKTQKGINEDLLEGDTKAELVGTVVVDDFGTTLKEPEAAEQAASLQSCLS